MIYCYIEGRMGDQMFAYAFARYLQIKGQRRDAIAFDMSDFKKQGRVLDESWCNYMTAFACGDWVVEEEKQLSFVQRAVLFLFYFLGGHCWGHPLQNYEKRVASAMSRIGIYKFTFGYFPYSRISKSRNLCLIGFFESPRYFSEIDDVLRQDFTLKKPLTGVKRTLYDTLMNTNSVCVHVRKGDYFEGNMIGRYGICGIDYYERAAQMILEKREDAVFYIFSDDVEWCRENIHIEGDVRVIKCSEYDLTTQEQLWVMTACRDFIISNSNFSWWAQHLACREGKMVIAPDRWRGNDADLCVDIYEENWITISVKEE